jgi:hypothetical protein
MNTQKLIQEAQQQLGIWVAREKQDMERVQLDHDQATWWRGRLETLQQLAAEPETPAVDQPAANEAALKQGEGHGID